MGCQSEDDETKAGETKTFVATLVLRGKNLDLVDITGDPEVFLEHPVYSWLSPRFLLSRVHPADFELLQGFTGEALPEPHLGVLQVRLSDANGRYRWVRMQATGVTVKPEGRTIAAEMSLVGAEPTGREELALLVSAKGELIEALATNLEQVTRTMSGYAGMLERHLSIRDDAAGSEYALGVRGGLEQLHILLHNVRPIARQKPQDAQSYRDVVQTLEDAMQMMD